MFDRGSALLATIGLLGCSSSDTPRADLAWSLEARAADARLADAPRAADARPDAGAAACAAGLDLKPLVLDAGYCVLYRVPLAGAPGAFAASSGRVWTYTITSAASPAKGELWESAVDASAQKLGAASAVFSFALPAAKVFASGYLARSPSGALFAAGYTEDITYDGGLFIGAKGATPKQLDKAKGNFDALFLDEGTLLINGVGLGAAQEGQGVYLWREGAAPRRLVKDLGTMSGHLALAPGALFAGGYFADGNKLYAFSLAEVKAAIASGKALSAASDGDLVYAGGALGVATLGEELAIVKMNATTFAAEELVLLPATVAGDKVTAGTPRTLVAPGGGVVIDGIAGDGGALAISFAGVKELAAIRRRP
jgi:hypothetical protein